MSAYGFCEHNTLPFTCISFETYVAHELSHHWWGNFVTEADWPEMWLSEGFASYSQAAWEEWRYGDDAYHDFMLETMQYFMETGEMFPIVPAEDYWCPTVYDKGSCVVHMLRHVVGDEAFWSALQSYLADNAYGSTTTEDLIEAFETEYGSDLDWFFDTWVYDWGYPDYELGWSSEQAGSVWQVEVTIEQVQTVGPVFTMPVDLLIEGPAEDSLVVMWNDQQIDTQSFTVAFQPTSVELDPDDWILHSDQALGIEGPELPPVQEVSVFPNPATSRISIGWLHHGHFTARIYDMAGRCMVEAQVSAASPLVDISQLPAGSYGVFVESISGESGTASLTVLGD